MCIRDREELFEVLAAKYRDSSPKPIGILNTAGFYNQLFGFFDFLSHEDFISPEWKEAVRIDDKTCRLMDYLELESAK